MCHIVSLCLSKPLRLNVLYDLSVRFECHSCHLSVLKYTRLLCQSLPYCANECDYVMLLCLSMPCYVNACDYVMPCYCVWASHAMLMHMIMSYHVKLLCLSMPCYVDACDYHVLLLCLIMSCYVNACGCVMLFCLSMPCYANACDYVMSCECVWVVNNVNYQKMFPSRTSHCVSVPQCVVVVVSIVWTSHRVCCLCVCTCCRGCSLWVCVYLSTWSFS